MSGICQIIKVLLPNSGVTAYIAAGCAFSQDDYLNFVTLGNVLGNSTTASEDFIVRVGGYDEDVFSHM
jgi:hypothetical protein